MLGDVCRLPTYSEQWRQYVFWGKQSSALVRGVVLAFSLGRPYTLPTGRTTFETEHQVGWSLHKIVYICLQTKLHSKRWFLRNRTSESPTNCIVSLCVHLRAHMYTVKRDSSLVKQRELTLAADTPQCKLDSEKIKTRYFFYVLSLGFSLMMGHLVLKKWKL